LFPYQQDIVRWSLAKGHAAIFASCGMGKTRMQLSWADHVHEHTNKPVLVLAPLAVSSQTAKEGETIGIKVKECASQGDVVNGVNVTNYEKLHKFDLTAFYGVVLDESSLLKSFDGKYRNLLVEGFRNTPFKLACTATPAPNDHMELGSHAEFLNVMSRTEMLATFFVHDGGDTALWRLKGHAEDEFWKWVASWGVMIRKPSDLGHSDKGFELPELRIKNLSVHAEMKAADGDLFPLPASSLSERRQARRASMNERVDEAIDLVSSKPNEQWLIWCDLNPEGDALAKGIKDAVQVAGVTPELKRVDALNGFAEGRYRVMVSKPGICGHGMNFQACHNMIFVGLSDSWEQYFQATRRCWRFGQKNPVDVYVITSHLEQAVLENIKRKDADAEKMAESMVVHMKNTMIENVNSSHVNGGENDLHHVHRKITLPKWISPLYIESFQQNVISAERRYGDFQRVRELTSATLDARVNGKSFNGLSL
jgi:superfamily II DNA or RNA helicase